MNDKATVGYVLQSGKPPQKWHCIVFDKDEYEKAVTEYKDRENYYCIHEKGKYIILYLEL